MTMAQRAGLRVAAIDLGSSSGRVMLATFDGARLALREVHRFANTPIQGPDGSLRWDLSNLVAQVRRGLALAGQSGPLASVAIDGWGVDYGLLGSDGELLAPPHTYRDPRAGRHRESFEPLAPPAATFARTGVEQALINTSIQLHADLAEDPTLAERIREVALLPDLIHRMLGAPAVTGQTIASTTSLAGAGATHWDRDLMHRLGLDPDWFAPITPERQVIGHLSEEVAQACGLNRAAISLAGTHDTAAAVQAIADADDGASAFVSCGSWSLVGVCSDRAALGVEAFEGGLTNEVAAAGQILVMRNLTGLWMVQQCQRIWRERGMESEIGALVERAAAAPAGVVRLDLADPDLAEQGDIPAVVAARIAAGPSAPRAGGGRFGAALGAGVADSGSPAGRTPRTARTGTGDPNDPGLIVRVILESLAAAYADAVTELEQVTGRSIRTIRMVGGGVRNALLCRLAAEATGRPVAVGHPEATALGNAIGQLVAIGEIGAGEAGAVAETAA